MQPTFVYNCKACGAPAWPEAIQLLHRNPKVPGYRVRITCQRCGHQATGYEHQRPFPNHHTSQGGN